MCATADTPDKARAFYRNVSRLSGEVEVDYPCLARGGTDILRRRPVRVLLNVQKWVPSLYGWPWSGNRWINQTRQLLDGWEVPAHPTTNLEQPASSDGVNWEQ